MNLHTATTLGSYTADQLSQIARTSGYLDTRIKMINSCNIRENDVVYDVEFFDPSGSFGDKKPVGKVFVKINQDRAVSLVTLEF